MNKTATGLVLLLLGGALTHAFAQTTLKKAFKNDFRVGAALNARQIDGTDTVGDQIVSTQFNTISPENVLKWGLVHPKPDVYDFALPDKYVEFGEKHHMFIIGHTLVWHNQVPKWVFEDDKGQPLTRDALLARLKDHIDKVVSRYKGRINGWDVVNEALNEDGTMRQSPWMKIIGEDYIELAFQYAHEADPKTELYYNDFNLENEPKRKGAIELIKKLKAKGVPIHAVGLQGHDDLEWPIVEQQDATVTAFEQLGVKVNITELDVTVLPKAQRQPTAEVTATTAAKPELNPYKDGLPDAVQQKLAQRYADLFTVFVKHRDAIERVTFWNVTDGDSWKNNFPVPGRTDYPLLFDRQGKPKLAFDAVIRTAKTDRAKK
jgi:endo-1,4-beta-xylanase